MSEPGDGQRMLSALPSGVPLGMVVEARLRGVVDAVGPILSRLEASRFRSSPELRAWALQAAGEPPK